MFLARHVQRMFDDGDNDDDNADEDGERSADAPDLWNLEPDGDDNDDDNKWTRSTSIQRHRNYTNKRVRSSVRRGKRRAMTSQWGGNCG
jgi:hypothetical protein